MSRSKQLLIALATGACLLTGLLAGCVKQDGQTIQMLGGAISIRIPEDWSTESESSDPLEFYLKHGDQTLASLVAEAGEAVTQKYPQTWDEELVTAQGMNSSQLGDLEEIFAHMQKGVRYFDRDDKAMAYLEDGPEGLDHLHMRFYDDDEGAVLTMDISLKPKTMSTMREAIIEVYRNVHVDDQVSVSVSYGDTESSNAKQALDNMLDQYDKLLDQYKQARKQAEKGIAGAQDEAMKLSDQISDWTDSWDDKMDELSEQLTASDLLEVTREYRDKLEEYRDIITGD